MWSTAGDIPSGLEHVHIYNYFAITFMLQQWKQETHWSLHGPILLTDKGCNFSSKMSNDLSESLRRWKTSVNTLNSRISSGWRNKQAPTCSWYGNKWLTWHWKDSTGEANKWWFHATESLHIKRVSLNTEISMWMDYYTAEAKVFINELSSEFLTIWWCFWGLAGWPCCRL